MTSTLLGNQSPTIRIELWGVWGRPDPPKYFDAVIDTGFTGAVLIPITDALPLGLTLYGTSSFTLADGSTNSAFLCIGKARLGNAQRQMIVSLSKGNEILIGTEFLREFDARLEVDYREMTYSLVPQGP